MNLVKHLLKCWRIISYVAVIFPPIIWIGLKHFDLLLVKFLWHTLYTWMYIIPWYSVVFVMMIRPLADLFPKVKILRQLCLLRRGFWIMSAMFISVLLVDQWISNPNSFLAIFTLQGWTGWYPLMARLSEVTAIILLLTSNNISQKILWKNWKRIQRTSYIYFIAGWIVALRYWDDYGIELTMYLVSGLFLLALWKNIYKKHKKKKVIDW